MTRRILCSVLFALLALTGGYATASPDLISSVRIEISICEREQVRERPSPVKIRRTLDRSTPAYRPPSLTARPFSVLFQRPPPVRI